MWDEGQIYVVDLINMSSFNQDFSQNKRRFKNGFQLINGLQGKLFLIGGHDLESEESTSEVFEILSEESYKMEKRTNMQYK